MLTRVEVEVVVVMMAMVLLLAYLLQMAASPYASPAAGECAIIVSI